MARDTSLGREVALKVLPDDVAADADRRARFEREARLVAAVAHQNIVTIHSIEQVDGRLFLTMELVKGLPLSSLIRRGGLPLTQLLDTAVPIANAVSAAHASGITHRDLKPANVMVGHDGTVKVLDFGVAKRHDALRPGLMHISLASDGRTAAMSSVSFRQNIEALNFDASKGIAGSRRQVTGGVEIAAFAPSNTDPLSVSPGGELAFNRLTSSGQLDLWVVTADGTGLRQLTNDTARDVRPQWSPDGKRLMFDSDRGGRFQVWTMAADGGGLMQVTDSPGMVQLAIWSPDGMRAAAAARTTSRMLLFDPRAAATRQTIEELRTSPGGEFIPGSWSADGSRIAGHVLESNVTSTSLAVYSIATQSFEVFATPGQTAHWLPDNRRLLYTTGRELRLFDTVTRTSQVCSRPAGNLSAPGRSRRTSG